MELNFLFWGCIRENVYATEVKDDDDLISHNSAAATDIKDQPRQLVRARDSTRLCEACVGAGEGAFWQFMLIQFLCGRCFRRFGVTHEVETSKEMRRTVC
jgi:hypothetical protein